MFLAALFLLTVVVLDAIRPPELYSDETGAGEMISVIGTVSDRYRKNDSQILEIQNAVISTEFQKEKNKTEKHGVLCYLEDVHELPRIGSAVLIRGTKELFQTARNPGQFDHRMYEAVRGMDYCLFRAGIIRTDNRYSPLGELSVRIRERLGAIYDKYADREDAGVLKAMTLGDRGSLDPRIKELYRRAGIAHVLSISGLHISLLGYGLFRLLKRLGAGKTGAAVTGAVIMGGYCMLTGNAASTVRAVSMFVLCAFAEGIGRTYDLLSALSFTLIVMLLNRPMLIHDTGFLLSFTAVLGIGLSDMIFGKNPGKTSDERRALSEKLLSVLKADLSVNLVTFPVMAFSFFQFSLLSPLLNVILIPFMGSLLTASFSVVFTALVFPAAAFLPAAFCHIILTIYERGCSICEAVPGAMLTVGQPSVKRILIYYLLFSLLILLRKRQGGGKKKRIAFIIAVMALPALFLIRGGGTEITVLDIGQGDCIYIRSEEGLTMLIDCGSSSESSVARYRVVPFLRSRGIKRIDLCVVTHTDADHINGFEELFNMEKGEGVGAGCLLMPEIGNPDEAYRRLVTEAEAAGCKVRLLSAGETFTDGKTAFRCLNPERGFSPEDKNTGSVVLEMTLGEFSAVFTGDVQDEGEALAAERLAGKCTLLKVAHHGSKNSSTEEFLRRASPRIAFISCGRDNRYGHPHEEAINRIEQYTKNIFITAECGAITLRTRDGRTLRISAFLR